MILKIPPIKLTLVFAFFFIFSIFNTVYGQQESVSGTVTEAQSRETLPGVNILVKGTSTGASTDADGNFKLTVPSLQDTLVVSFVGYQPQQVAINGRTQIDIQLAVQAISGEEMVVVGYGTRREKDLTGSVVRADMEAFSEQPNVSLLQSLQGSVPGLNVGQINEAGEEPDIEIRGRTSLSGELDPLIVLDGVIYRGSLNDINPSNIESVDVLKDASATAIYGSQASNGVIILTTTKSGSLGKPDIAYSTKLTLQSPAKEFPTGNAEDYLRKTELSDLYNSRTEESDYLEPVQDYDPSSNFKTNDEITAYNQGRSDNWYDMLTNDHPYIQNHNLSLANTTELSNYYISIGYTDQTGYMENEGYKRINGRINLDSDVTDWLNIGLQTLVATSNFSVPTPGTGNRYLSPFATARNENGELIQITGGNTVNPIIQMRADELDDRLNLFGNFFTDIDIPYVEGLSYKGNFSSNWRNNSRYYFRGYESNFQGEGSKREEKNYNWSSDHILTFQRTFNNIHNLDVTILYGVENRESQITQAQSSIFANPVLGYDNLQIGSADQQEAISGGWEEASLYQMARVFYGYNDRYLLTGTIRRDGFSGFGKANKFGIFPSLSVAWVASEESFINKNIEWLDNLKFRISYGSNGNRTIDRYQTLATVSGGFNYITAGGTPVFTQAISKLASPDLKWETTTGFNFGIDFRVLSNRVSGSLDYYNDETTDLLYQVDIPGVSRFETFPDNLGRLHNQGIEVALTSVNIQKEDWSWETSVAFSRNRNELKELLGFDTDGDGKEDDLVSEGLFIGEPIDAIYDYSIDGYWQVDDEIPAFSDLGAYKVLDINDDDGIDPADRSIIGYQEPSYRLSISNAVNYKNWTLRVFINSIQGGKNRYMAENNITSWSIVNNESHFNLHFSNEIDFWTPENPNAQYQRPNINVSEGIAGTRYAQRSFVRLQDVSLSYTLPQDVLSRFQIQNLKILVSGKNLATWTNWSGWDPETGQDLSQGGRPVMRGYTVGVDLSF